MKLILFDIIFNVNVLTNSFCIKVVRDPCQKITLLLLKSKSVKSYRS